MSLESRSTVITTRLDRPTFKIIDDLCVERGASRSAITREILERYAYGFKLEPANELAIKGQHVALIAPTLHGKTVLTRQYIVPRFSRGRGVLVIDPHWEYVRGYAPMWLKYERTVPPSSNQLFQMFTLQSAWDDADKVVTRFLEELQKTTARKISVRLDIVDPEADKMIVSLLLKRLTQTRWSPAWLVVVEEAARYDCLALVSRGRHAGIRAVLISQFPLPGDTMTNVNVVLGPINPKLVESIDPAVTFALLELQQGEFVFETRKGRWARFQFKLRQRR